MLKPHWDVLTEVLPLNLGEDTRGIVAVDDVTGEVYGGVVFQDWTVTVVCAHIVIMSPRAFRMNIIPAAADYVFNQAGRLKMIGMVPAKNEKALKLNKHIGFTEIYRIEEGYDHGEDYVVMELIKENCPYWEKESGKKIQPEAA